MVSAEGGTDYRHDPDDILLVEDNPNDAELAVHALRKSFLANHIELARDGVEALDFLFRRGVYADRVNQPMPRLILLDIKLPRVDGLEVLRQIKADPRTKNIPVVILTASAEQRDIIDGYALGVNGYVVKPFDFAQFTESVRTLGLYWLLLNRPVEMPAD
jgi:two-component system response regulator